MWVFRDFGESARYKLARSRFSQIGGDLRCLGSDQDLRGPPCRMGVIRLYGDEHSRNPGHAAVCPQQHRPGNAGRHAGRRRVQPRQQGDERAARKASITGNFLIGVTIVTLLLVTIGLLWSAAKHDTDLAEKGLILVRVLMV
jgi:hypothetical protein